RQGVWRRYRYSDLDLGSMIRHTDLLKEELRFPSYKLSGSVQCGQVIGISSSLRGGGNAMPIEP
ncbi:hypothetical protein LCGC14_1801310, partial [marine sediment metagenome]